MHNDRRDDTARFMQSIAAFSADIEPDGDLGRRICLESEDALAAILTEIAETVLRRYLTFTTQSGFEVQVDVAERRVHRILAIPRAWCDDFGILVGVDLSDGQGADVVHLLARLGGRQGDLWVKTGLPDREKAAGFKGVTVRELQEAQAALALFSRLPSRFATAMSGARSVAVASVVLIDGVPGPGSGDPRLQQSLRTVCATVAAEDADGPPVQLWHAGLVRDCSVIVTRTESVMLGLLVPSAQMTAVFGQLNAAVSRYA